MRRVLLALPLLAACGANTGQPADPGHPTQRPQSSAAALRFDVDPSEKGLVIELSEARAPAPSGTHGPATAPSRAESLSDEATEALLARLLPLTLEAGDRLPFAKREDSKPPPRTGVTVDVPFPPPAQPDAPEVQTGPLHVVRVAPEGDVEIAPHLSVTFDQPVVAVTSQDEAARIRPVRITPQPPGQWRWVGAKTLLFEPEPRFPMATEYQVEVPAGTTSAIGGQLESAHRFTFRTPPPKVVAALPNHGPHGLDPLVFVAFDQAVPESIVDQIRLTGEREPVPLRAATPEEQEGQTWLEQAKKGVPDGRAWVMKPLRRLKPSTNYAIVVPKGTPSAEGPRVTESDQSTSFWTYPPLTITHTWCDQGPERCTPGAALQLGFANPLDEDAFDPSWVTVEPALEHLRVRAGGSGLVITGRTLPETTYTVRVAAPLQDVFGQTLGEDDTATFRVGHAREQLVGPPRDMLILDPAGPPALSVFSVNLKRFSAKVHAVAPEDFASVSAWMRDARYDGYRKGQLPGTRVATLEVPVTAYAPDEMVETAIDLAPYLGEDGFGHLLLWIEPPSQPTETWNQIHHFVWVQRTAIGLTAIVDQDEIYAWATSLADGKPLADVQVSLLGQPGGAATATDGAATLGKYPGTQGPHALIARRGDDLLLLPRDDGWWNQWGGWSTYTPSDGVAWFVFDDRRMYRPGETVSIKGWMRRYDQGPGGGLDGTTGLPRSLTWSLRDSRQNPIGSGKIEVSDTGAFDLTIPLPKTPNLGLAQLDLSGAGEVGGSHRHTVQIQEFRRPEFQVETTLDPRPYVLGEHALATVRASYYAGGALPAAPAQWAVTRTPATFTPPGRGDYRFGPWTPWWGHWGLWGRGGDERSSDVPLALSGQTDAAGEHTLRMDFVSVDPPRPYTVRAEATVVDVNRQRWTRGAQLLLHPASQYVGLKTEKGFYEKGEPIAVDVVVADLEGALVAGRDVRVTWSRLAWVRKDGVWQEVEETPTACAVTSQAEPGRCTFVPVEGGNYRVRAQVMDPEGRPNETVIEVWVSGGDVRQAPSRQVTMEQLVLVPDGASWQPGDVARVLVQSPFHPAEGQLVIGRNGVMETRRFRMEGSTTTLEIPITEAFTPNVQLRVDVVGAADRRDDDGNPLADKAKRVAFASAELSLPVPPLRKTLAVEVAPRDPAVDPGGQTLLDVTVRDAAGQPVQGEVAVVVVDESVLALSDAVTPDPVAVFYAQRGSGFSAVHGRGLVVLADPEQAGAAGTEGLLLEQPARGGLGFSGVGRGGGGSAPLPAAAPPMESSGDMKDEAEAPRARKADAMSKELRASAASGPQPPSGPQIELREDFSALALFAPHVETDASGKATVPLTLPDSLTRYRILAVAASDDRFGVGESAITARKPVMLRPSPPRFLNFGDRMELPLVVQNQTTAPLTVDLALRVANARVIETVRQRPEGDPVLAAGRRLTIPAEDRREVRIPVAADMAGTARFQVVVATGDHTDAASFAFPVWTPATGEAFATYGTIPDSGGGGGDASVIVQPVATPGEVWPQFGGLEIQTSSTAVQALTDAVLYLVSYPYDCSEQIASRVLAVAGLRDVLGAFAAAQLPEPAALESAVRDDLERIRKRQHGNGGWSYWPDVPDEPYLTVHVTHALARAKAKGFAVDANVLARARGYLTQVERHIPAWYGDRARWSIRAYAVHVRHQLGDTDGTRARELVREAGLEGLPLEAQGWLLPVLQATQQKATVDAMVRHWENRVSETASTAQFNVGTDDQATYVLLHSDRRVDAVLLEALVEVRPGHDLIPKVVRGLLGHRTAGRWSTTQENGFVLVALDRYFRVFEGTTPDFVARAWLGDRYAGEHTFRGRTTERANIAVPMAWLTDPGGTRDLVLQRDGVGRMYYRIGMTYAPRDLTLEPADRGFTVERVYEAVDDPRDVRRDGDGTWRITPGARVRVRLTLVAAARRYHVALVDPLPGGFEAMNPELATTGTVPADPNAVSVGRGRYWWWWGPWYEHQNVRDERVEAFTRQLWDGVHTYTYVATATTPGHFVVPPAKAEEMYAPETFGRSGTDHVVIE